MGLPDIYIENNIDIMVNIKIFETESAYESYIGGSEAVLPNVSLITENQGVYYKPLVDYSKEYLTFEIKSDGYINFNSNSFLEYMVISYQKNDDEWVSITATPENTKINVVNGDIIKLKGNNEPFISEIGNFTGSTCQFIIKGNVMSIVNSIGFVTATTLYSSNFSSLFENCTGLTDASNLVLPATTLTQSCYQSMFAGCTSLATAPVLPATTLAISCYQNMFYGCTSLTTPPELPATTLAQRCYTSMFFGCTSLTTAPELPATTLANNCYDSMFVGCTHLTTAPELPATALTDYCYQNMFYGCTALNYIKMLATENYPEGGGCCGGCGGSGAINVFFYWVYGVASTGTFVKASSVSVPDKLPWGVSGVPNGWTVQNA